MYLTNQQIRFFRDTGYLKLKGRVANEYVAEMMRVIDSDLQHNIEPFRTNANGDVVRLDKLVSRAPVFLRVLQTPLILNALESILGPNVELTLNRHNHATFNSKGHNSSRLHRDVLQWTRGLLTAIIYLEDANTNNGCTYVVPTSQYLPFVGCPNNGGTWMDEHDVYADLLEQAVPIPMPAGGVLLLDSLVFHSIGENTSQATRKSLCFGFHSVDELIGKSDNGKCQVVLGERIYRGNDREDIARK